MGEYSGVNVGGPNWNANRNALTQIVVTAVMAALAAYVALNVGLSEIRANQISMDRRMDRIEAKLDRITEYRGSRGPMR